MANEELLKNIVSAITNDTPDKSKDVALALIQSFREEVIEECKEVIQKAGGLYFIQDKLDQLKQHEGKI